MERPIIINDREKIAAASIASLRYLGEHSSFQKKMAEHLWAYHEIGDLVPQTLDNFMSGHYFPYSESYYELENSFQLCMEGFYTYAFVALRSVLELGILGVYFAVDDREYEDVRPWITSQVRTPKMREALKRLKRLETYGRFDERFGLSKRILETYDSLGAFVHTRGYRYSSSGHTRSNFNRFSIPSLNRYGDAMFSVVSDTMIVLLLKYPIGMQPLPLAQKFGLNEPAGGFLNVDQVRVISAILCPEERDFLRKLSDNDLSVCQIVEQIGSMPDLSEEEWRRQSDEFDEDLAAMETRESDSS